MTAPKTADTRTAEPRGPVFEAFAQVTKMLLPSSGCFSIHEIDGDMTWCSDGFGRPDFRQLVEDIAARSPELEFNLGVVRETTAGVTVLIAKLGVPGEAPLGYVLIELAQANSNAAKSMAASMTRPIFRCLATQMALAKMSAEAPGTVAETPAAELPQVTSESSRLDFLLGIGQLDLSSPHAIRSLLQRCVDELDCLSAVFCIPDQDFSEMAEGSGSAETRAQLDATRKHLLAWVQLNNRPMVVNRVDSVKAPFKILSCPVVDEARRPKGLMALFRGPQGNNFELDDVRLMEFLAGQGMALITERHDAASGLMSRAAFEARVNELFTQAQTTGALLYVNISELSAINASFGYAAGDEAILRMAQLINRHLTPGEFACRLAGDRFVACLPERACEDAVTLGEELVSAAGSLSFTVGKQRLSLSLTFGVADAPESASESRHWIAAAELACRKSRAARQAATYNRPQDPFAAG